MVVDRSSGGIHATQLHHPFGGVVYDLHGGLVDVQRMNDLQLRSGRRRRRRRSGNQVPAGYPEELLDLQTHPARFAILLFLVDGPLVGQRERGGFPRHVADLDRRRLLDGPAVQLFLFDLFAVFGQQLAIGHGHFVGSGLGRAADSAAVVR